MFSARRISHPHSIDSLKWFLIFAFLNCLQTFPWSIFDHFLVEPKNLCWDTLTVPFEALPNAGAADLRSYLALSRRLLVNIPQIRLSAVCRKTAMTSRWSVRWPQACGLFGPGGVSWSLR
jgi:hypothetical protein